MRKMVLAALAATMMAQASSAAVTLFNVTGTFTDGRTLTGSFQQDDAFTDTSRYSAFNLTISNYGTFTTPFTSGESAGTESYYFQNGALPDNLNFAFVVPASVMTGSMLSTQTQYYGARGTVGLFAAVIAAAAPAPSIMPEPASWAMMLAGFGAIGAAIRRRKVAVSFA